MKPLIAIPSPRDIPRFKLATDQLKIDKYWVKYEHEDRAYHRIKDFFLRHEQYTHLILLPDDLIVEPQHLDQLLKDIELGNQEVITGMCNIDLSKEKQGLYNICFNLPDLERETRNYQWVSDSDLLKQFNHIIRVEFSGEALMSIRRDVVKKLSFDGDLKNSSYDLKICHELAKLKIPVYVDTRIKMLHLRYQGEIMVNRLYPDFIYEHDGITETDKERYKKILRHTYEKFANDGLLNSETANNFMNALYDYVMTR